MKYKNLAILATAIISTNMFASPGVKIINQESGHSSRVTDYKFTVTRDETRPLSPKKQD